MRKTYITAEDIVRIDSCTRTVPRVKIVIFDTARYDAYVARNVRVYRVAKPFARYGIDIRKKIDDLTARVNARVGSSGARDAYVMAVHPPETFLDHTLNRSSRFLDLPPEKICAVVRNDETDVSLSHSYTLPFLSVIISWPTLS
jgi:hypothetical protein